MNIFFSPDIHSDPVILNPEESAHAIKVFRLKQGDRITVVDGKGGFYEGEIIHPHTKKCEVRIIHKTGQEKSDFHLHIAVAPTKNNSRMEWFLEKATEIGINEITPLICNRSERKSVKTERLNKVILAAMKQSLKAELPKLNEAVKFKDLINSSFEGQKFIAHCSPNNEHLKNLYRQNENALILIGPEGDFTEEEIKAAMKKGFQPISMGKSRLRTETAAIVACHVVNLMNE